LFEIILTERARKRWDRLKADAGLEKQLRAVRKTLRFLSENPRHPGLRTHEFTSLKGPQGEKVFEAYAEQSTPAAYRVFWYYGPEENRITVIAITPHP
jgi:mRNA-degrading endonuclease RelE of RelBE toxin-antitoxin system